MRRIFDAYSNFKFIFLVQFASTQMSHFCVEYEMQNFLKFFPTYSVKFIFRQKFTTLRRKFDASFMASCFDATVKFSTQNDHTLCKFSTQFNRHSSSEAARLNEEERIRAELGWGDP